MSSMRLRAPAPNLLPTSNEWLRDRWFWNEAYFLRAFLSHNNAWEVVFFNNYVRTYVEDFLKEKMPLCLNDVGGSLYIRRIAV